MRICDIEGCGRKHDAKGLCKAHYRRLSYSGTVGTAPIADKPGGHPRDAATHFRQSYDVAPSGCWIFRQTDPSHGYGVLSVNNRRTYAHRFSYQLHKGPIPPGKLVRHTCDNKPCVNPEHLLIGTTWDNAVDRETRGLGLRRFSRQEEDDIRTRYANGETQVAIARDLGVSGPLIWKIVNRSHLL